MIERWGSRTVPLHGGLIDASTLPALVAGDQLGLTTFMILDDTAELVTLDAVHPRTVTTLRFNV